jgi:hypothetical protein
MALMAESSSWLRMCLYKTYCEIKRKSPKSLSQWGLWAFFMFNGCKPCGARVSMTFLVISQQVYNKEERRESWVLSRGRHLLTDGEMGEKGFNFGTAHVSGMAFGVKENVAAHPINVTFFGAVGVVLQANGIADLIQ